MCKLAVGVDIKFNEIKQLKITDQFHNAGVGGSSPPVATISIKNLRTSQCFLFSPLRGICGRLETGLRLKVKVGPKRVVKFKVGNVLKQKVEAISPTDIAQDGDA